MGKVLRFPMPHPYPTFVSPELGKDVTLIADVDAARITGLSPNELSRVLDPINPVSYFKESEVLALRDRMRETKNGA